MRSHQVFLIGGLLDRVAAVRTGVKLENRLPLFLIPDEVIRRYPLFTSRALRLIQVQYEWLEPPSIFRGYAEACQRGLEFLNCKWLCRALEHVACDGIVYGNQDRPFLFRHLHRKSRRGAKWIEDSIRFVAKLLKCGNHRTLFERRQEAGQGSGSSYRISGNEGNIHSLSIRELDVGPSNRLTIRIIMMDGFASP